MVPADVASVLNDFPRLTVLFEPGAGVAAGFSDQAYLESGAQPVSSPEEGLARADVLLRVKRASGSRETLEIVSLKSGAVMIGFLDPQVDDRSHLYAWADAGLDCFAFELVRNAEATASFNATAAMSRFAGRIVVDDFLKLEHLNTLESVDVLVLGSGNAGVAAAQRACELGGKVVVMGTSKRNQPVVENSGAAFFRLPDENSSGSVTSGICSQRNLVRGQLKQREFRLVVCAARRIGQRAPVLIDQDLLPYLAAGFHLYDLAASSGGNCAGVVYGADTVVGNGIIHSRTGYPAEFPHESSIQYSGTMLAFLRTLFRQSSGELLAHIKQAMIVSGGKIHPALLPSHCPDQTRDFASQTGKTVSGLAYESSAGP